MNKEQDRIDSRQVTNIYRMMNQGNQSTEKRRQASPFLNYALDKYNVTLEDVPLEQEGFETSSEEENS